MCKIKDLDRLMEEVRNKFHWVNYGGCGSVAAIIGNLLQSKYEIRIALHGRTRPMSSFDEIRDKVRGNTDHESINNWYDYGVDFGHVWVEFRYRKKWYAIDAGDCVPVEEFPGHSIKYEGYMTLEDVEILAENPEGWNDMFNREQILSVSCEIIKAISKSNI